MTPARPSFAADLAVTTAAGAALAAAGLAAWHLLDLAVAISARWIVA